MDMQDDKIRKLLSDTTMKAGENLKFRIMHQIEAEHALSRQKKKAANSNPLIGNMIAIFGIMYTSIAILALGTYFTGGKDALESILFFAPLALVASACGVFWMISMFDDRRRIKHKIKE